MALRKDDTHKSRNGPNFFPSTTPFSSFLAIPFLSQVFQFSAICIQLQTKINERIAAGHFRFSIN
ncbi:hypothetical protein HN51_041659 [Arachis hypogaea]